VPARDNTAGPNEDEATNNSNQGISEPGSRAATPSPAYEAAAADATTPVVQPAKVTAVAAAVVPATPLQLAVACVKLHKVLNKLKSECCSFSPLFPVLFWHDFWQWWADEDLVTFLS
jgi:hypothetical protein